MRCQEIQDRALVLFGTGYNCAQAAFAALAPESGLDENEAMKIASAFGGGVARSGGICGALSGALMALGLRAGSAETSPEIKTALYDKAAALIERFKDENGATDCRDLIACELSTPEGQSSAAARNVHATICVEIIKKAVAAALDN